MAVERTPASGTAGVAAGAPAAPAAVGSLPSGGAGCPPAGATGAGAVVAVVAVFDVFDIADAGGAVAGALDSAGSRVQAPASGRKARRMHGARGRRNRFGRIGSSAGGELEVKAREDATAPWQTASPMASSGGLASRERRFRRASPGVTSMRSDRPSLPIALVLLLALLLPGCRHHAPPPAEAKSVGPDGQPIHAQGRGESAASHLTVQGDYQVDAAPPAFCTLNADKAFQVTWRTTPEVVLRIENFKGAGEYEGEARVRSTYTGEAYRTSKGNAKVSIQVTAASSGSLVSGSFSSAYTGESGKGNVSGSFERCPYDLADTTL
jgi:hypothetical protein